MSRLTGVTVVTDADGGGRRSYHHGDLAATLISATADLVAEKGPSGFSLREVARRAGVSPAAPSHHFGHARGLLTAVAVQGFEVLDRTIADRVVADESPVDQLQSLAFAYVDLGLRHPGHVAVMFRPDLVDTTDEAFVAVSAQPLERLRAVVGLLTDGLDPGQVEVATRTIWATLNGFVNLYTSEADGLEVDADLRALVFQAVSILHLGTLSVASGGDTPS